MPTPFQLPQNQPSPQRGQEPSSKIEIDCTRPGIEYERFWESTGFSAAVLTTRPDMRQTLALCRGIAHGGFRFIRPHYLLNLVIVPEVESAQPTYDWSRLDAALDVFLANGLKPIFEVMGFPPREQGATENYGDHFQTMEAIPETCFDNLDDDRQIAAWYRLVEAMARHLLDRYGADEVRSWWFEAWNEPNIAFWKWSFDAFLAYWDATSEALRSVDPELRFGGPGNAGACTEHLWKVLEHCLRGKNHITGTNGSRIDFISVHSKGPCDRVKFGDGEELAARREIAQRFPELAGLPFFNDECDPVVGWSRQLWWHAEAYYPAWVARSVVHGLRPEFSQENPRYCLMSSDNTFMGSWGQRVLHHRFANDDFSRVSLVKKPVSNGMSLIGKLEGPAIVAEVPEPIADRVAMAATRSKHGITLLASNLLEFESEDFDNNTISPTLSQARRMTTSEVRVRVQLSGLGLRTPTLVHYRIDDDSPNPFHTWQRMGEPTHPSDEQLTAMRRDQEVLLIDEPRSVELHDGTLCIDLHLPCPSISLIQLLERPDAPPPAPRCLTVERFTGATGSCERILQWDAEAPQYVRSWEVSWTDTEENVQQIVSQSPFIDTVFVHAVSNDHAGQYRVRALDFWGRRSPWSAPLSVRPQS